MTQLTHSRDEALHIAWDNRLLQIRRSGVSQKTPGCRSEDIAGNKDETLEQGGIRRLQRSLPDYHVVVPETEAETRHERIDADAASGRASGRLERFSVDWKDLMR